MDLDTWNPEVQISELYLNMQLFWEAWIAQSVYWLGYHLSDWKIAVRFSAETREFYPPQ